MFARADQAWAVLQKPEIILPTEQRRHENDPTRVANADCEHSPESAGGALVLFPFTRNQIAEAGMVFKEHYVLTLVSGEQPFDRTGTDVTVRARTARGAVEKTPRADTDAMHGAPESAQKPSQKHGVVPHNAKTTKPCSNPKRETEESYTTPDRFFSSDIWVVSRSNICRRTGVLQE